MSKLSNFNQVLIQSEKILKEYDLCENCLGRLFSKKLRVSSNRLLGKKIKKRLRKKAGKCHICKNLFSNLQPQINQMLDLSSDFQFSTFLTGAILRPSFVDRDDSIRSKFRLKGIDSIKTELTRDISKKFAKRTKKKVDYRNPDVTFILNFKNDNCEIRSKSLFLFGRYTKKTRELKQKQKPCENCAGKGCLSCNNHGISNFDSVAGKISDFLFKKLGARKAKFMWIGGEDRKSLVLGKGRPFFVTLNDPRKRKVRIAKKIKLEKITLLGLNIVDQIPKEPIRFRSKIMIKITSDEDFKSSTLTKLKSIKKTLITVRENPGKESKKMIYELNYKKTSPTALTLNITVDGGLPIKKFVEGNNVNPNLSQILDLQCKCKEFDFYDIKL